MSLLTRCVFATARVAPAGQSARACVYRSPPVRENAHPLGTIRRLEDEGGCRRHTSRGAPGCADDHCCRLVMVL